MLIPTKSSGTASIVTAPPGRARRPRAEVRIDTKYLQNFLERGVLTRRDETVLLTLNELSVLSTDQLSRLYWQNRATASRRLRRLYDLHLLDRTVYEPEKMKNVELVPSIVYCLGRAGYLWLNTKDKQNRRHRMPPRDTVIHDMSVAEIMVRMTEDLGARQGTEWQLSWTGEHGCRVTKNSERGAAILLEPDSIASFRNEAGVIKRLFIERDLGTESHQAFKRKVFRYQKYRAREQDWRSKFSVFPPVLVVANTPVRAERLVETIREVETNFIWAVTSIKSIQQSGNLLYDAPLTVVNQRGVRSSRGLPFFRDQD